MSDEGTTLRIDDIEVVVYRGEADGVPVVQIDGPGMVRVNMNEGPIWNADTDTHRHTECSCVDEYNHRGEQA